ncbi:MAG: hypothetical protein JXR94_10035, partial [Candidatus Hydrogenedentes bacterium]|nr:hypothetical protein [Candidatus Hydrogenedentota bacterium]
PEHHPRSIFPETRSVVVIGKRIARGCLRGTEEGTQMTLYQQYAVNWVPDRFLALTTVSTATFLEDHRWEAVPLPNLPVQAPAMGVAVRDDAPAPNVMIDFNEAAVRAGLGIIGYNGELMTPQFGPRQRIQIILTDAELAADPLCDEKVCDYCKRCVAACPLHAIDAGQETELEICGLRMPVAAIDYGRCASCRNGASGNPFHPSGRPDRLAAACTRACVHHLEEEELVSNRFRTPFRRRPAWQIDGQGATSLVEEA